MPISNPQGKPQILHWIKNKNISTVLDVGPGVGTYADLLSALPSSRIKKIDAVEVWEPYVDKYNLQDKYNKVFVEDIRDWSDFNYDLVIFGDVLEHMSKEDAVEVWERVSKQAKFAIISIPIIHLPQGEHEGNQYEIHVKDDWTTREVLETFKNITKHHEHTVVGVFYAQFGT